MLQEILEKVRSRFNLWKFARAGRRGAKAGQESRQQLRSRCVSILDRTFDIDWLRSLAEQEEYPFKTVSDPPGLAVDEGWATPENVQALYDRFVAEGYVFQETRMLLYPMGSQYQKIRLLQHGVLRWEEEYKDGRLVSSAACDFASGRSSRTVLATYRESDLENVETRELPSFEEFY